MTIFATLPTHTITAFVTAFLASTVEFIEALTIVLAVGIVRGWRHGLAGAAAGAAGLALAPKASEAGAPSQNGRAK
ncbi:MAG: hypothetical protein ACREQN_02345 [Candidatus Binataceae bacterium]